MVITIHQVILHRLAMDLKNPFTTNLGNFQEKDFFVIEIIDENGERGYGETVAFPSPWYTEETVETCQHVMKSFLIPLLFQQQITHPDQVSERFQIIRRNNMAKAALEGAVWDLYAKKKQVPLATALGGTKKSIDVGVSIGIQASTKELVHTIEKHLEEGYKRVKLKIKPGSDITLLKEVRKQFPAIDLMVDANSAYTLNDTDHLKQLDDLNLLMLEQPLAHDDFLDHAKLQSEIQTPVCLDESIHSFTDAKMAVELGSCQIINIKVGRVGGITAAKRIHDYCAKHEIPVWCGGMLEAGVGRAHSIAISTLPQFVLPGDVSASNRYWEQDIIQLEVTMENAKIKVPTKPGIGYEINWDVLESYRKDKMVITR